MDVVGKGDGVEEENQARQGGTQQPAPGARPVSERIDSRNTRNLNPMDTTQLAFGAPGGFALLARRQSSQTLGAVALRPDERFVSGPRDESAALDRTSTAMAPRSSSHIIKVDRYYSIHNYLSCFASSLLTRKKASLANLPSVDQKCRPAECSMILSRSFTTAIRTSCFGWNSPRLK